MTTLEYSFSDNLITMNFFVKPNEEAMAGFTNADEAMREVLLVSVLQDICEDVGVIPMYPDLPELSFGLIQTTPMRYGWKTDSVDEMEIRAEIAKRTKINLRATVRDTTYCAGRSQHGDISFKLESIR